MAIWTSVSVPPKASGKYRVKCGLSHDTFWAIWKKREKIWTNLKGEEIAFGRTECGDTWREAYQSVRSNVQLTSRPAPNERTK